MVTRFRVGTNRPVERLTLHMSSVSPIPRSYREAFNGVNWHSAMRDEYNALIKNNTWTLVPQPPDVNVVRCMWLFRHKYLADGTLSRYKARMVANGSTQLEGVDVDETFSPVLNPRPSKKYATEILEHAGMVNCNPNRTPVDTESKPDISYAVQQVRVLHVPSRYQFADIFTKGLPTALFEEFHSSLSVRYPPA
nr:ribonuclease H-like domain-containing protein [Tanacetum cinerariifolium]